MLNFVVVVIVVVAVVVLATCDIVCFGAIEL